MAIQRIQTDHGSEFGTDFTWHLQDVGILQRRIPRGYLERAKALRESLLAFIEHHTRQRLVFRPFVDDNGNSVFPTAHLDRELARIIGLALRRVDLRGLDPSLDLRA